jgi:hypothetical protein
MPSSYRSAEEIVRRVITEKGLKERVAADPVSALQELADQVIKENPTVEGDVWIYRIVVALIGATALIAVCGAIWIASRNANAQVPDILTAIGSGAIGALAGLLSPVQYRR